MFSEHIKKKPRLVSYKTREYPAKKLSEAVRQSSTDLITFPSQKICKISYGMFVFACTAKSFAITFLFFFSFSFSSVLLHGLPKFF